MRLIELAVKQPISVAVGVILTILSGLMALDNAPIQMTPSVDSVVISVSTYWENASPIEIESDIIDEQEQRLANLTKLVSLTSSSEAGVGHLRLEFKAGTDIEKAMIEVSQKLDEVSFYPEGVSQPQIIPVDRNSQDYIAWVGLASTDNNFDPTTLYDFMHRQLLPRFERIEGVSKVEAVGVQKQEVQIHIDPTALAYRRVTYQQLLDVIRTNNSNFSAGKLQEGKNNIRIRTVGRFANVQELNELIIRSDDTGTIYLSDIAEIKESYKERTSWVRARGISMPFINFQLQHGANLLQTMDEIQFEIQQLNADDGLLARQAQFLGLEGRLELVQTYDASTYVDQAIELVQSNIYLGGLLATLMLLVFLRSLRTIGIIALVIPISVLATMTVMVAAGRTINIVSLAGMAFAVGMVVDNAIVVIENIYRHLEMDKSPQQAALDGAKEVGGAVFAATITTVVVFFPILLIDDAVGQLFRDIALAIMFAVGLSLLVSLTVIPSTSARWLRLTKVLPKASSSNFKPYKRLTDGSDTNINSQYNNPKTEHKVENEYVAVRVLRSILKRTWLKLAIIGLFFLSTGIGTWLLVPPIDYLPKGNRNVGFSLLIAPPGYHLDHLSEIGERLESHVRPAWEASHLKFSAEMPLENSEPLADIPIGFGLKDTISTPAINHYFLVGVGNLMFQIAVAQEDKKIADLIPFMNHAIRKTAAPDVIGFSFQFPLFRTGGATGSAITIDLSGADLNSVIHSAKSLMQTLQKTYGPYSTNPDPANFLYPTPELRIYPKDERLRELGLSRSDIGLAVQANGDGLILVREFEMGSELRDMKIISSASFSQSAMDSLLDLPIATPSGAVVDLKSVASIERIRVQDRIKHVDRLRAVSLQLTPPKDIPLQSAIDTVDEHIMALRSEGGIASDVGIHLSGSAGRLNDIKTALFGNGSLWGVVTSPMFLALFMVYLVMVILFQNWRYPLVIMLTVPLATLGGFIGLALMHHWSMVDRYIPVQNLDVLTLIGFVILTGVVVNNAILIVHQTLNFLRQQPLLDHHEAIIQSVSSRVRPILMGALTSVGGMLPLVFLSGAGSELYRGLGSVVVGGLILATVFTLILVPLVLSFLIKPIDK